MNSASKTAALLLLTVFLAGCRHRTNATLAPESLAPVLPVSDLANNTLPDLPPAQQPQINPPPPRSLAREEKPKPPRHIYRKPRHTTIEPTPVETPAASQVPTEQAATAMPTEISPIGQLSPAGDSSNVPRRKQILDEIDSTQKGLDTVTKRSLSKEEQATVAQIKTFLEKAKTALNQADLDGAHTLVTKARVLLDEIAKS